MTNTAGRARVGIRPDTENFIKLGRSEAPVSYRDGAQNLGVKVDLVKSHAVVDT